MAERRLRITLKLLAAPLTEPDGHMRRVKSLLVPVSLCWSGLVQQQLAFSTGDSIILFLPEDIQQRQLVRQQH